MKGKHKIVVKNNRLHYEFEIKRNITIIKGDSATGKTTLINMIRQFANLGNASGIEIECDAPCTVLEGNMWQMLLKNLSGNIIFIDEENQFIRQQEFAAGASSLIVATADSVVRSVEATDVAFCNALLVTFTGSRIPLSTISTYSSVAALKPVPGADSFTLLMITAPSSPAFAAI